MRLRCQSACQCEHVGGMQPWCKQTELKPNNSMTSCSSFSMNFCMSSHFCYRILPVTSFGMREHVARCCKTCCSMLQYGAWFCPSCDPAPQRQPLASLHSMRSAQIFRHAFHKAELQRDLDHHSIIQHSSTMFNIHTLRIFKNHFRCFNKLQRFGMCLNEIASDCWGVDVDLLPTCFALLASALAIEAVLLSQLRTARTCCCSRGREAGHQGGCDGGTWQVSGYFRLCICEFCDVLW